MEDGTAVGDPDGVEGAVAEVVGGGVDAGVD